VTYMSLRTLVCRFGGTLFVVAIGLHIALKIADDFAECVMSSGCNCLVCRYSVRLSAGLRP